MSTINSFIALVKAVLGVIVRAIQLAISTVKAIIEVVKPVIKDALSKMNSATTAKITQAEEKLNQVLPTTED